MRGGELNVVEDDDSSKGKEKEKELSLQCWLKCKTRFLIVRAREKYRSNRCFLFTAPAPYANECVC